MSKQRKHPRWGLAAVAAMVVGALAGAACGGTKSFNRSAQTSSRRTVIFTAATVAPPRLYEPFQPAAQSG